MRPIVFIALIFLAACNASSSGYYDQMHKLELEFQKASDILFQGEQSGLEACNRQFRLGLSNDGILLGCKRFIEDAERWLDELASLRRNIGSVSPPRPAQEWHARYLLFVENAEDSLRASMVGYAQSKTITEQVDYLQSMLRATEVDVPKGLYEFALELDDLKD